MDSINDCRVWSLVFKYKINTIPGSKDEKQKMIMAGYSALKL